MLAVDRLVARAQIGVGEELQELVGAGAADDVLWLQAIAAGDRLAESRGAAIGIALEFGGRRPIGGDGGGAGAKRRFI